MKLPGYHPKIDPANFTDQVTNPYFPLQRGRTTVHTGSRGGVPRRSEARRRLGGPADLGPGSAAGGDEDEVGGYAEQEAGQQAPQGDLPGQAPADGQQLAEDVQDGPGR